MQNKKFPLLGILFIMLITACDSNEKKSTTETSADSVRTETDDSQKTAKGAPRANIQVTITGGDMAGSYSAVCTDACCSWGIAGEKVFGNQYSETGKGPKELSSVQLIIDDVTTGNKTTKEFTLTVSFGELFGTDSKSFNINTRKDRNEGSGTADIKYSGNSATISIKGVSKEGPSIDLKMECMKVSDLQNIGSSE